MKCSASAKVHGFIVSDLIISQAKNQKSIGIFNLAVNKIYKPKDARTKDPLQSIDWFTIYIYDPNILKLFKDQLQKGTEVIIKGILRSLHALERPISNNIYEDMSRRFHPKTIISVTNKNGITIINSNSIKKLDNLLQKITNNDNTKFDNTNW